MSKADVAKEIERAAKYLTPAQQPQYDLYVERLHAIDKERVKALHVKRAVIQLEILLGHGEYEAVGNALVEISLSLDPTATRDFTQSWWYTQAEPWSSV